MARNTRNVFLQGKAKWCRVVQPNPWGKWTIVLYPNAESLEQIRELQSEGLKNVLKKDEDGYFITFNRPTSKLMKGKVQGFAPPEVLQADGVTPCHEGVGNGSDVTIKLEVYSFNHEGSKGIGARLSSIRVDILIPYTKESFQEDQLIMTRNLDKPPAQEGPGF